MILGLATKLLSVIILSSNSSLAIYFKENFSFGNKILQINQNMLTWEEAAMNCEADRMKLATINEEKWRFGSFKYSNFWIGHQNGTKCAHFTNNFTVFEIDCATRLPFLCEADQENFRQPFLIKEFLFNETNYFLYHGRLPFPEALHYCNQFGYTLASVENEQLAEILSIEMLKNRPKLESVWIGALFRGDSWTWIYNNDKIKTLKTFPVGNHKNVRRRCVIFDRHLEKFAFVESDCTTRKNFVCMKGKKYEVIKNLLTWQQEQEYCKSKEQKIFIVKTVKEAKILRELMQNHKESLQSLWLGGKFVNETWVWIDELSRETISPTPWFKATNGLCLNVDLLKNGELIMYGVDCEIKQGVICVKNV